MLSVVSLFSGAGGFDYGFHIAGYKTLWANDFNKFAVSTFHRNFPESDAVCADISQIPSSEIPDADVIIGGFPCQDFSILGKRQGVHVKRGKLYKQFVRILRDKQPKCFVAENVKGIVSANKGMAIKVILHDFRHLSDIDLDNDTEKLLLSGVNFFDDTQANYRIFSYLYNFAEYGVPQLRERFLIIGIRKDIYNQAKRHFIKPYPFFKGSYISAGDVLEGKALYYDKPVEDVPYNNQHHKTDDRTKLIIDSIPPGGNYKDISPELSDLVSKSLMSNIYRRLHRDKPSTTIIANGGGGTLGYHYKYPRPLTNRERARLQTFPDDFIFDGSIQEVRKQIGNAVPPLGIAPVAFELKNFLVDNHSKETDGFYQKYLSILRIDKQTQKQTAFLF